MASRRRGRGGSLESEGVATYDVGRGEGASVPEVLTVVREVTGTDVELEVIDRWPGDPVRLVVPR